MKRSHWQSLVDLIGRGSLPIAMLLHVSINVSPIFLPESSLAANLWLLLIVGLAFWMWRSPRRFLYRPAEHE